MLQASLEAIRKFFVQSTRRLYTKFSPHAASESTRFKWGLLYAAVSRRTPERLRDTLGYVTSGLTESSCEARVKKYGPNELVERQRPTVLFLLSLLRTFVSPVIILLLVILAISLLARDGAGSIIILSMVGVSVVLTFVQEQRSRMASARLQAIVTNTASVLRREDEDEDEDEDKDKEDEEGDRENGDAGEEDGGASTITPIVECEVDNEEGCVCVSSPQTGDTKAALGVRREVPVRDVVIGDIIFFSAGDIIPADVRLLSARDLFINQSSLTGESEPVEKDARPCANPSRVDPLHIRNICFSGSHVVSGTGTGVVLRTGRETYMGAIAKYLNRRKTGTQFERGVRSFMWLLIRIMAIVVPLVFLMNGFLKGEWLQAFLFATAVAVGLTPEMLPMILTVNLAKGAMSMSKKRVIVKHLHSIQNFGAMDILCTDKTGTLTQDRVFLEHHIDVFGKESMHVLRCVYLNSFHQTCLKNLLDRAILQYGDKRQIMEIKDEYVRVDEIPFDFQRRRMTVVVAHKRSHEPHQQDDFHLLICKGAPEEVSEGCRYVEENGEVVEMTPERAERWREMVRTLNNDGLRVIAVASKQLPPRVRDYTADDEKDLTLLGFVSFLDPPKETTYEAVSLLNAHGVQVKVLTGDNEVVSRKLTSHVGIPQTSMSGREVAEISDEELMGRIHDTYVFAKLSPFQKERLVRLFKKGGHIVGFMGDGINDAPSLRAADVGISVENGVDIAKEAADIILLEKSLLILKDGILEGRRVFGNIIKYIFMGVSGNFGNIITVVAASIFLPFLPILPLQLLLQNMLYDFSQTTIPFDNVDPDFTNKPRRWHIGSIKRFIFIMGPLSSVFDLCMFAWLWFGLNAWYMPQLFQTGWFVEGLVTQTLVAHVVRTRKIPFLQSQPSLPFVLSTLLVIVLALIIPYSFVGPGLRFVHLPPIYFLGLVVIAAVYIAVAQKVKSFAFSGF